MKKLLLVLLILLALAIAISISPLAEYIYSLYAAEMPSDTRADTAAVTTTEGQTPQIADQKVIVSAVALSTASVVIAFVIFLRKRFPGV